MSDPTKMDLLVSKYIEIRNMRSQLKAEHDAAMAPIDDAMNKIENALLARFNELGVDSVKTSAGTAYIAKKTNATLADWDAFKMFLEQQDDPYMYMERRVSKAAVQAFREDHNDLPPGINWTEVRSVNIRRS